jgi:hypothetical protein
MEGNGPEKKIQPGPISHIAIVVLVTFRALLKHLTTFLYLFFMSLSLSDFLKIPLYGALLSTLNIHFMHGGINKLFKNYIYNHFVESTHSK